MTQIKEIEKTGKTVEDAISAALQALGATKEEVEVNILEEASKGLFGLIGVKPAKVLVKLKPDLVRDIKSLIKDLLKAMEIEAEIVVERKEDAIYINLAGENLGLLIGRRGDTLDALQYLLNLAINKNAEKRIRLVVDVENYRQRREETLIRLARRLSEKVRRTGSRVVLEPMSPQERRIIHTALQGENRIYTYSEGEEPFRKVVIAPKERRLRTEKDRFSRSTFANNGNFDDRDSVSSFKERKSEDNLEGAY